MSVFQRVKFPLTWFVIFHLRTGPKKSVQQSLYNLSLRRGLWRTKGRTTINKILLKQMSAKNINANKKLTEPPCLSNEISPLDIIVRGQILTNIAAITNTVLSNNFRFIDRLT